MTDTTVVLVPGLRGHVEDHWQTRLAASLPNTRTVTPLGRDEPSLIARVALLESIVRDVEPSPNTRRVGGENVSPLPNVTTRSYSSSAECSATSLI